MELSDHLFRRESGRMVAALTRIFGVHNLALAEMSYKKPFCVRSRYGNSAVYR
jgi:RNA polymerase sigma-70 factor (ECF subfamily)